MESFEENLTRRKHLQSTLNYFLSCCRAPIRSPFPSVRQPDMKRRSRTAVLIRGQAITSSLVVPRARDFVEGFCGILKGQELAPAMA